MIKRCNFQLKSDDNYTKIIKENMLQMFDNVDTSVFRFCAIGKENYLQSKDSCDYSIAAYFFREQGEMNDYILFNSLLWDKTLFPNDSSDLFVRLLND